MLYLLKYYLKKHTEQIKNQWTMPILKILHVLIQVPFNMRVQWKCVN